MTLMARSIPGSTYRSRSSPILDKAVHRDGIFLWVPGERTLVLIYNEEVSRSSLHYQQRGSPVYPLG
jgi:hypothetical protein